MKTATLNHECFRQLIPKTILWLSLLFLSACGGNGELSVGDYVGPNSNNEQTDFQIGASWSAQGLNTQVVTDINNFVISRGASSSVLIRTIFAKGSGLYLGRFNDKHIVATNAHVLKNIPSCAVTPVVIQFKLLNAAYTCEKVIGIWRDVDFAIIALRTQRGSEALLNTLNPPKIAFNRPLIKNTLVYSFGHGSYQNSSDGLTLKADDDCRIYSQDNTLRRLSDPNQNGSRKIPSFAIGCDISPGDSGSPIMDRQSGDVYGFVWSTQTPKPITVKSSVYMERLRAENTGDVWKNLAYAIPASAIRDELLRWSERVKRSVPMRERRAAVLELLGLDPLI